MRQPGFTAEHWFTPGKFALLTACLLAACFPGVILGRDSFFFRDFAIFSYPLAAYHKTSFWHGEIPLWNPYNSCGLPFLAQWNTMVLYPFSAIYLLLPLPWSLNFFCLFHLWLGGCGMYFLARAWTGRPPAAALAGVAYLFNGVVLSCLKWPNNIAALAWMPWVIWTCENAFTGTPRAICIAAFAGAIQMLSGAPEIIVLTWLVAGSFWLLRTLQSPSWRAAASFPLIIALVSGLCAVQLLPFLDLLRHSQRDASFAGSQWPMPPWGWANFLVPLFRTWPSYHQVQAQPGQYWISTYYVSIAALLLAIVAVARVRTGRVRVLAVILLFGMWMALGDWGVLYKILRASVPGIGMMRFPIKFIVLAAFVLPLLAAFGLQNVLSAPAANRRIVLCAAGALAFAISALLLYNELNPFRSSTSSAVSGNGLMRLIFLAGAAALLLARSGVLHQLALPLLTGCVAVDGLTHTAWQNPVAPSWVYTEKAAELQPPPLLGRSRAMISPEAAERIDHLKLDSPAEDVLSSRLSLYCNVNLLERIPKVDGFYAIYPREFSELQSVLYTGLTPPAPGILDFLGVTQISAPGAWNKWQQRESALPLITAPAFIRHAGQPLPEVLRDTFDPRQTAFVAAPEGANGRCAIRLLDWAPHRIRFECDANSPARLVIAQTFYPSWKASLDGAPLEIERANHAFQSVAIPAGAHAVELRYADDAFAAGRVISVVSALLAVAGLFALRRHGAGDGIPVAK